MWALEIMGGGGVDFIGFNFRCDTALSIGVDDDIVVFIICYLFRAF